MSQLLNKQITLLIIAAATPLLAQEDGDLQYRIVKDSPRYSFFCSFKIDVSPECLLDLSFQYEHMKALAPEAKDVLLIDKGTNWNKLKYIYEQKPIYRNETLWKRVIDTANLRVEFNLLSSENNHAFMPNIVSSGGYYQITPKDGFVLVEYFQQCELTNDYISNFYLYILKRKATNFVSLFYNYALKKCE